MKSNKYPVILSLLIILAYIGVLIALRINHETDVKYKAYQDWQHQFIVKYNSKQDLINTIKNNKKPVALSEGQGYGMQIIAKAGQKGWAKQSQFERLLAYYLENRITVKTDNNKAEKTYLMSWQQQYNQSQKWVGSDQSATDGDLYIAQSLLTAAKTWPQSASKYRNLAKKIADDILKYEYNQKDKFLTTGSWVTKSSDYYQIMRTSDVMPSVFDNLHEVTKDSTWQTVNTNMLQYLSDLSARNQSGLLPDFAVVSHSKAKPAKSNSVAGANDGDYSANACRVPMMLADSSDKQAKKVLTKLMNFFKKQSTISAGYTLKGKSLNSQTMASFNAPIYYAASVNHDYGYDILFKNQKIILSDSMADLHYYDATLTVLSILGGLND